MNIVVSDSWNAKKIKLRNKYAAITDADLQYMLGKENEMVEKLGFKLGKSRTELLYIIAAL
jgi:hypothetical protein